MNALNILHYLTDHIDIALATFIFGCLWWFFASRWKKHYVSRSGQIILTTISLILSPAVMIAGGTLLLALALKRELGISDHITLVTVFSAYIVSAWFLADLVALLMKVRQEEYNAQRTPGLLKGLVRLGCLVLGFSLALVHMGYSITGLLISTSVLVALVGLALQRTLGDLFSGIALSLDKPFELDDWLQLNDGTIGQVIDINWRATRLKGWDKVTYVIPNGELANQIFKNFHNTSENYAPWYEFKISADVDPRLVKAVLLEAALGCKHVLKQPVPVVRLIDASEIPYTYTVWVHFENFLAMFAGREELLQEIHFALNGANIRISAPSQELFVRKSPTKHVQLPSIRVALKAMDTENVLTDEDLEEVSSSSTYSVIETGTTILDQDEIASNVIVITGGIVESSLQLLNGERKVVDQLGAGAFFGVTSSQKNEPSKLRYKAITEVRIIRILSKSVRDLLERRPELAERFDENSPVPDALGANTDSSEQSSNQKNTFGNMFKRALKSISPQQ